MPTLAARLAVSFATASVVMAGIEAWRVRHPRAATRPELPDEPIPEPTRSVPQLGFGQAAAAEPPPAPKPARTGSLAMARISGRVVGSAEDLEDFHIEIEDESRSYQPRTGDDGTFEINLPVGSYTVTAISGDRIAVVEVAGLLPEESREVVLALGDGGAITGRVEGCKGPCAEVGIRVRGPGADPEEDMTETDQKGEFAVEGLAPGKGYDLTFEALGKRRVVMRGVVAPRQGLVVTLAPAASLSGGFGLAPGEECPMESVALNPADEDGGQRADFDRACRFHFDELLDSDQVHLSADGEGWHFELDVPVPAHGDPPFLCLHPPCREPEPAVEATLEVLVSPTAVRQIHVTTQNPEAGDTDAGCPSSDQPCLIENLRPGRNVKVDVQVRGCEGRSYTLDIHAGRNYLASPCEGMREVRGAIRRGSDEGAPDEMLVRCSSQHQPRYAYGGMVRLQCPVRLSTIEYQLGEGGMWLSAAVTTDGNKGIGTVEITVP